jgi:hypothetical protein
MTLPVFMLLALFEPIERNMAIAFSQKQCDDVLRSTDITVSLSWGSSPALRLSLPSRAAQLP